MSEQFKMVADRVWIFDTEYVPCFDTIRRVYGIAADKDDAYALQAAYDAHGATEEKPKPLLKNIFYRVVSISAIIRERAEATKLTMFTLPNGDLTIPEADIIGRFLSAIGRTKPQLVGWASTVFDLPVLYQRALVNGISVPEFCWRPEKPWDGVDYFGRGSDWNVDLLDVIVGHRTTRKPSLSETCLACRIPGKIGMDGSMVADAYAEGRLQDIVNYNEFDTASTYLLWLDVARLSGWVSASGYEEERDAFRNLIAGRLENGAEHWEEWITKWDELQKPPPDLQHVETPAESVTVHTSVEDAVEGKNAVEFTSTGSESEPKWGIATTVRQLLTGKQRKIILDLCSEMGFDGEEDCQVRYSCGIDELSKAAAVDYMTYLRKVKSDAEIAEAVA